MTLCLVGNAGGDLSTRAGDLQVSSNPEAPDTLKVFEAWCEHRFLDGRLAFLFALRDLHADFHVLEHAGLFLNASFGIGIDASQVPPSTFPTSAFGVRLRVDTSAQTYLQVAAFDGVPGDPDDPYGTAVQFNAGDGVYVIGEAGLHGSEDRYFKLAAGGWYNSARFEDFAARSRDSHAGGDLLGEVAVARDAARGRGVGLFAQAGCADGSRNQVNTYPGGGCTWTGPSATRSADVRGAAVAHARNGEDFRSFNPALRRAETTLEFTYLVTPLPWLAIQPDVQYIIDPGTDDTVESAVVVGFRLQATL